MKKIIGIFICLLLISATISFTTDGVETYNPLDGGWIEEKDGVTILHVSGTNYEMGYQHGFLLKDNIKENMRMILEWFEKKGYSYDVFIDIWTKMKEFLPQEYMDEILGMADGMNVTFEEVAVYNTWPAVINHALIACCGASTWSSATIDKELYHVRSLDILHPGLEIKDTETGKYFRENQLLIVRQSDDYYNSVYPASAGAIYSWGGINENGIAISANTCLTNDSTYYGISAAFRMRLVLDHAKTTEDAINIINSNRTCGWNYIISDAKIPEGYVIEQTANIVYIGNWSDPVESTEPFWEIREVVRRTPMFISPICAETQQLRKFYDPSGIRGFLLFSIGKNLYFTIWSKYRALSNEFEKQWGKLDLNSTISLLRNVYLGKTDILFYLTQKLSSYKALHQWVACPITGDLVISFSDEDNDTACENLIHYFNLFELISEEPP